MSSVNNSSAGGVTMSNIVLKSAFCPSKPNFAHINLGTFKKHKHEIEMIINNTGLDVLAVSETWFTDAINSNKVNIPGSTLLRHDRKRTDLVKGGEVA